MIALDDLKRLAEVKGPCLSVFQPLRADFARTAKTDARLMAAAHLADGLLQERGLDEAARKQFLRPIERIANNSNWSGRTGGLVIFRAPGFMRASFWPGTLDAQVRLG